MVTRGGPDQPQFVMHGVPMLELVELAGGSELAQEEVHPPSVELFEPEGTLGRWLTPRSAGESPRVSAVVPPNSRMMSAIA